MTTPTTYDTIIIGSGQGGTPLARAVALAHPTHKTALIEREHIGGCCVNEGCTPTKTMIASGRVAYLSLRQRKRDIVGEFRAGSEKRLKDAGVDVLMGEASFVDGKTMVVVDQEGGGERVVRGEKIVINTGCRPVGAVLDGLERVGKERVLDSTRIMELGVVPGHLVVVGGGYIGVEFGQLFRRLGARVTLVHRGGQLLPREDGELAGLLGGILKEDGVEVMLETRPVGVVDVVQDGGFDVRVSTRTGEEVVKGVTHILFATGRVPNTERLNAGAAGVKLDEKGYVVTDEFLRTSASSIFAIGDVKGPPSFTHISYDDFRVIKSSLLESKDPGSRPSITDRIVPYVVYTDPQFGHVGLHEHEARQKFPNKKILTAQMPMSYVARALETDESRGAMKAVVDGDTGSILGFSCLGAEGGELMSVVQTAMMGNLPYQKLQDAVFAHPTFAESLNNLWGFLQ
ncbi:hypothetical protein ASPCADRAFT_173141 [Aspergillus carbonarius ITEM 5010]|uniref:FAD/NAD(P)-binding domain-containing protein n=1 Tax=Aspergillus carbonarius (strain ITEM 5010) TaxID=602072 RepID=A0A1R3RFZ0_ASPC5|nr:hypothetical protein ASPCADRAFT_173141 [Aspergillus carbonarius ITEM 5010]